ncbi:MAG: cobyric acid synthase [Tannerellaceae bacterium]|nr:cobyric acid synthase [Tannerellaceae bacterium]
MKKLRPIMFAGTGSEVGKSVIATAFCRIFLQDGYRPAPFKAQNMSLNSYATAEDLEIGRAQAVQAEAARLECHTDMNPLLLKPASDQMCQVVLNGRPVGNQSAGEYFGRERREDLRREVCAAFDRLEGLYNPIVMEGAGSLAEINLREADLVNMSMAMHAGARVILVADIDRGGVFASVYGSVMLLTPRERQYLAGVLINKFRGDMRLFEPGVKMLEELCHVPVLGVIPYYDDIYVEEEDSVSLRYKSRHATAQGDGRVNVAVVSLAHMSNYTDFDVMERDRRVHLYYTDRAEEIRKADVILIPGTKNTLYDLSELRRTGAARSISDAHSAGAAVIGICGGYQMMGLEVSDPYGMEGDLERLPGLGLLPVVTRIGDVKLSRQASFSFLPSGGDCAQGYEIHMGQTWPEPGTAPSPLNRLESGAGEGFFLNSRCFGSYMHGMLDNKAIVDYVLAPYAGKVSAGNGEAFDHASFKDRQYDRLADHVRSHVDMQRIYNILSV